MSVALVICLNVGVDPPDVTKTQPCARVECWVDPMTLNPQRALEAIGNNLQRQYERWQPRARYRQSLDPTVEEVRRLATGLRRNARDERVLFHYNGHGVPKPTGLLFLISWHAVVRDSWIVWLDNDLKPPISSKQSCFSSWTMKGWN